MDGQYVTLVYLVILVAIFYLLVIRPQQVRNKERRQLLSKLKVGDEVVTIGGLYGRIRELTDETATLEVTEDVQLKMARSAIAGHQAEANR